MQKIQNVKIKTIIWIQNHNIFPIRFSNQINRINSLKYHFVSALFIGEAQFSSSWVMPSFSEILRYLNSFEVWGVNALVYMCKELNRLNFAHVYLRLLNFAMSEMRLLTWVKWGLSPDYILAWIRMRILPFCLKSNTFSVPSHSYLRCVFSFVFKRNNRIKCKYSSRLDIICTTKKKIN